MNKFDVCIFDLDGTLINSLTDLGNCTNEALSIHSLPIHPLKNYKKFVGNGVKNLIKVTMGSCSNDEKLFNSVYKTFCMLYNEKCLNETRPYDGITEMIANLKLKGVKCCILSNKTDDFVSRITSALFKENDFDLVWGKKNEYPTKPSPDSLLAMLKQLSCPAEKCLYIGDSDVDVITAQNAGVSFCGVAWGFRGTDELIYNGAKTVVTKPYEINKLVTENE